jgi:hypothetical protein
MQVQSYEKDHDGMSYRLMVRTPLQGRTIIRFQIARLARGRSSWWTIPTSCKALHKQMETLFLSELHTYR